MNISYFDNNKKLSFIKLHLFNSELKKNEESVLVLTEWIKECLKRDKSTFEFMIIDNNQSKKHQIEILRNCFKFKKIVYTNIHCLKDCLEVDSIGLEGFPNGILTINSISNKSPIKSIPSQKVAVPIKIPFFDFLYPST